MVCLMSPISISETCAKTVEPADQVHSHAHNMRVSQTGYVRRMLSHISSYFSAPKVPSNMVFVTNERKYEFTFRIHGKYGYFSWTFAPMYAFSGSVDDLYHAVDMRIKNLNTNGVRISYYMMHRGKLLRKNTQLDDYGFPSRVDIVIHLTMMYGGSQPPLEEILKYMNPVVKKCEEQVIKEVPKFDVQSLTIEHFETTVDIVRRMPQLNGVASIFDKDWIIAQMENINATISMISKCETAYDFITTTQVLYRLYTGRVATVDFISKIKNVVTSEIQSSSSEDTIKKLREMFDGTKSVVESPLVVKIKSLYCYMLTQGFLKFVGLEINDEDYSRSEQRILYNNYSSKKMFIIQIFDTSLLVCERYFEYRKTGQFSSFVTSSSAVEDWTKNADRILGLAPFVGNLQAHGTSYFSFISDLNDLIEKGDAYSKYATKTLDKDNYITRKLNQLKLLKNTEITRKAAQQERSAPMGVLIYGHSSVAKSAFTKMLFNYYGGLFDLDRDDQYRYVRNPLDEYWSNFDTSKWCIQLDDIAFLNPAKTTEVDSTLQDLLNVVNNVPYVPPQAALEDKGKTPVLAKLVLATSNCKDLNALEYFWCPLAVRRRLPYVVNVEPKDEFKHQNGMFIDPKKMTLIDGEFPNWWKITVQKVVPEIRGNRENARLETVAIFENTNQFLQHFGKACLEHEKNQQRAILKNDDMQTIKVCKNCFLPLPHNECAEIQSLVQEGFFRRTLFHFIFWILQFKFIYSMLMWTCNNDYVRLYVYKNYILKNSEKEQQRFLINRIESQKCEKEKKLFYILGALSLVLLSYYVYTSYSGNKKDRESKKNLRSYVNDLEKHAEKTGFFNSESTVQGNQYSTTEDDLAKTERTNVWYNPTLDLSDFDVPLATKSMSQYTSHDMRNHFSNNCYLLKIRGNGATKSRWMRGVFTRGHLLITNKHAFEDEFFEYTISIYRMNVGQNLGPNHTFKVKKTEIGFHDKKDVAMVEVLSMPPHKDITNLWCEGFLPVSNAIELTREEDGTLSINEIYAIQFVNDMELCVGSMDIYHGMGSIETKKGMCGSLCVAKTPQGPIIIGIHIAGKSRHTAMLLVTKGDLFQLEEKAMFSKRPIIQGGGKPQLGLKDEIPLTVPHHKSILRYLETGTLNIYGSFAGARPKPKSKVCETPLQEEFLQHYNVKVEHGAPCMTGWEPWRKNVVEMIKPNVDYKRDTLKKCVEGYTRDIISNLPQNWKKQLVILSDKSSVNGLPGVIFIDGINRKSSMGFPWNKSKKNFLHDAKDEKYPDGCDFGPEVWDRVRHIENLYSEGKRAYPVFTGHLKDEATPLQKVEIKKTRLFTGAPIDWSLVVRKNLLSFVRLVQLNKYVFEAGPGMVTQSIEWTELYHYLCKHGDDQIVAGDYGKFDKRMIADFILAAFDVIINIHREAGFSDQELKQISGIAEDTAFPLSNLNNDLVEFFGTNPSGHPLTVIINSLVNALYMRYCYVELNPHKHCTDFKENVSLMTYGDDNVMGVSKSVPWFNHTAIQNELSKIGVEYTMADKESESVPYIDIGDVSFLKRKWRFDSEIGAWMAPLEEASIIKSLTMWVPSGSVDKYHQMVDVMNSASSEYFFYGREIHDRKRSFFRSLAEREPYKFYVQESHFPDYDQLVDRFRKASELLLKERSS